jgi:hypothetical protein
MSGLGKFSDHLKSKAMARGTSPRRERGTSQHARHSACHPAAKDIPQNRLFSVLYQPSDGINFVSAVLCQGKNRFQPDV